MRRLALTLATVAVLAAPASASAACADADLVPTAANLDRITAATFCLHNEERANAGLAPLGWNDQLAASARGHSLDMVERLFFEHTNLDGETPRDRIEATGYGPDWSGENIAWGAGGDYSTPAHTMEGWMNSKGHRENVLREEFEHLGIGVAYGAPQVIGFSAPAATYAAHFGSRSLPAADEEPVAGGPETAPEPEAAPEPETAPRPEAERKKKLKRCLKRAKKNKKKRKRCKRRYR